MSAECVVDSISKSKPNEIICQQIGSAPCRALADGACDVSRKRIALYRSEHRNLFRIGKMVRQCEFGNDKMIRELRFDSLANYANFIT